MIRALRLTLLVALAFVLAGCSTSVRETFHGQDAHQVWTAMVAAARTPDYSEPVGDGGIKSPSQYTNRWVVRENQIWVDEPNRRIEIFRRVERDLHRPGAQPMHEERQWKLRAVMEKIDPPEVEFTSRQMGVPSHAWDEAERFFDDIWKILGGRPGERDKADEPQSPEGEHPEVSEEVTG